MDSQEVAGWLRSKENRRYGVLEEHTDTFQALFSSRLSPLNAAIKFDSQVRSSKYTDTAWRFRQVLFTLAAESLRLHDQLIQLLKAIRFIPPRPERPNSLDAGFTCDWRDMHDALWGRRMLAANAREGLDASAGISGAGAERAHNLIAFSAKLVGEDLDPGEVRSMAFFDIRDARENHHSHQGEIPQGCILSDQQLKAVDVKGAALWILYGGRRIFDLRNEDFDQGWEARLAKRTDLCRGEPGPSHLRWELWTDELSRIAGINGDEAFQKNKALALQAVEFIRQQRKQSSAGSGTPIAH